MSAAKVFTLAPSWTDLRNLKNNFLQEEMSNSPCKSKKETNQAKEVREKGVRSEAASHLDADRFAIYKPPLPQQNAVKTKPERPKT